MSSTGGTSGVVFSRQPVLELQDANGNRVDDDTSSVTATVDQDGELEGTTTVQAVDGIVSFTDLALSGTVGTSYTLTFSTETLSTTDTVTLLEPGAVSALVLTVSSTGGTSGVVFSRQPVLELRDANGNRVDDDTSSVTATVDQDGVLEGTTTVTAVDGTVSFTDLRLSGTVGTTYTLIFTAESLSTVDSMTLNADCMFDGVVTGAPLQTFTSLGAIAAGGGASFAQGHSVILAGCATLASGDNSDGQLGIGRLESSEAFTPVASNKSFTRIAANALSGLALTDEGEIYTWGTNAGLGYTGSDDCPESVGFGTSCELEPSLVDFGAQVSVLDADVGLEHAVVVGSDGTVYAWGRNELAQLGNGTRISSDSPIVVWSGTDVRIVSAGFYHTLALADDGTVYAWGAHRFGELGYPAAQTCSVTLSCSDTPLPVEFPSPVDDVIGIAAGDAHSMAATRSGDVWMWGDNTNGELGTGTAGGSSEVPQRILSGVDVISMAAGSFHNLVLASDGTLYAWGSNSQGQLGDGTRARSLSPKVISQTDFIHVEAAGEFSMAVTEDGSLYVWGDTTSGQLGLPSDTDVLVPTRWTRP